MPFPTDPERALKIDILAAALRDLPMEGILSYEELGDLIAEDLTIAGHTDRLSLVRAKARVERESGFCFETVRKVGLKKLSGSSLSGIGVTARRKIARKAAKEGKRLASARYNLSSGDQAKVDAERSLLGAICVAAKAEIEPVQKMAVTGPMVAHKVFDLFRKEEETPKK